MTHALAHARYSLSSLSCVSVFGQNAAYLCLVIGVGIHTDGCNGWAIWGPAPAVCARVPYIKHVFVLHHVVVGKQINT